MCSPAMGLGGALFGQNKTVANITNYTPAGFLYQGVFNKKLSDGIKTAGDAVTKASPIGLAFQNQNKQSDSATKIS